MSSSADHGGRLARLVATAREVANTTREHDVSFLAAGVAYYAFVSLLPAVVLALVVATALGGAQLRQTVLVATSGLLTESGQQLLVETLAGGTGRRETTVFSLVLALWGALKVLRGLDTAFSSVYGVEARGILDAVRDSLLVALSVSVSVLVMVLLGGVVAALRLGPVLEVASFLVLPAVLSVAFFPMYYVFPDVEIDVWEAVPGAVFAGVGWTVLQAGFQLYVEVTGTADARAQLYGVIGGVLLLVTWLYLGSLVVLLGAVVNVVRAPGRTPGSEGVAPGIAGTRIEGDRHGKGAAALVPGRMSEDDREVGPAPDVAELGRRVADLRADLDDVEARTVPKPDLEAELKRYVRVRMRRGHARGWGPYLVLLYGVVLTLGAFYWLDGWVAIAAMVVLFLSTLGLYVLFVLVGAGLNALSVPGKALDAVRDRRGE